MNSPPTPPLPSAAKVYKRLLSYARPHRGMFMIGVFGMLLFAATDGAFVYFVQKFVKGMTELQYESLASSESGDLLADSHRRPAAVPAARHRRLHVHLFSRLCRPAGHQEHSRRPVPPVPAPAGELLRPRVGRHVAVEAHVQHRAGGRGHHQIHHLDHPRLADHRRADRHDVLQQLAAGRGGVPDRSAAVLAGAQGVEFVPPLQRAHPGFHG